jgi:hypothetical protein
MRRAARSSGRRRRRRGDGRREKGKERTEEAMLDAKGKAMFFLTPKVLTENLGSRANPNIFGIGFLSRAPKQIIFGKLQKFRPKIPLAPTQIIFGKLPLMLDCVTFHG